MGGTAATRSRKEREVKYGEITVTLFHDEYSEEEIEDIFDQMADWLHDLVCGIDHGPNNDEGVCKRDFGLFANLSKEDDEL